MEQIDYLERDREQREAERQTPDEVFNLAAEEADGQNKDN